MILFTYTYITYILLYIYNTYSVFIIAPFPKEPLISHIFYTYLYTMSYAMEACKKYDKEFVVFDRPNPINGADYEGNILDLNYRSFVGYYPIFQILH